MRVTHVAKNQEVRTRHAFNDDEWSRILRATLEGPVRRKMTGRQRWLLYRTAAATGFRAAECAALRKQDFAADMRTVHLEPQFSKNGEAADQPIPPWLRDDLRDYLANLRPGDWLWPGGWRRLPSGDWQEAGWIADKGAGKFFHDDAADAGIKIGLKAKGANGGRVLDFHSWRHVFGLSLRACRRRCR